MSKSKKRHSLGPGFTDELVKVTYSSQGVRKPANDDWKDTLLPHFNYFESEKTPASFWRPTLFSVVSLVVFFVIFLRLFHLQVVMGKANRNLADGNRIQVKIIHAPRGVIFDRNGQILAANAPAFRLLDKSSEKAKLISREQALELEVKNDPRVADLEVDNVRSYPQSEITSHLIGYVGEISPKQLQESAYKGYRLGDRIGQIGIEAQYESLLRGIDGGEIIEVDSQGKKVRTLRTNPPIAGEDLYLNIDLDLQKKLYSEIQNSLQKSGSCCAAAVALNPQNGQVLALVSFPSFDPNIFSRQDDSAISQILTQSDSPILNRVISGTYPPGSTFKIVSSLAALSSGKITPHTEIVDNGVTYLGTFKFTNWYFTEYGKTEGSVDLLKAIQRSNDTYFYLVGQTIGEQTLIDWSKKLNLGQKLGIDLPGEVTGLVPDGKWKQANFDQPWYPGDTLHMAIGQGFVLTTPLQIASVTSYVAADGTLYKPQLVQKIVNDGQTVSEFKPQILLTNLASKGNVEEVKQGLKLVTKNGGTAWPFFTFPIETAGKTGTAEFGDPKGKTHAWYTSFAPALDPKIVLTVLVESSGEGSNIAAPIAKETYRYFLSADKHQLIRDTFTIATESARIFGE